MEKYQMIMQKKTSVNDIYYFAIFILQISKKQNKKTKKKQKNINKYHS
jgi:hypothetical protein